ncbi:MAG: ShlB/FhaC/HecB family hemolysin secretion/activation protein [Phenylobacterium sp.]|uniref:ShlB/FhaC/HecB family hemolysin secretion/activation protein n=1 Tax=Phenylobacterium sp. TaxID=1871053 RepID=UPI001A5BB0BB|nr:ShlB/FhaC/HecB family hemolysin secretion/activation protein [Phenylobacterium sp.]MBL8773938.1 ShlB/FhaC/HecB family hemolysin secretion/activation protein [Phenylobacterium sp.]
MSFGARLLATTLALGACAAPIVAHGQPAPAPSRQELDRAQRAPARPGPAPDLFSSPEAGPCPLAENPAPLTVTAVRLNGLESVPAEALAPAYAPYLNRAAGDAADLCLIRDAVSDALFDRGVLARVEIPAQTIGTDGVAVIEVIEARIVNVTVRGDAGPAAPMLERYAAKLRGMTPFDINQVQRYVLLASDLPGLRVQAAVRPSPGGERGAVDLDLNVQRDPQDVIVNVQNLQAKATGRWGVLAQADFHTHTAFGEKTSLVAYRTIQNEQWVLQLVEEARFGGEGLTGRASIAYGKGRPGDVLKPLQLRSESLVVNAELAYPIVRKRRENLWIAGGLELIDQETRISGAGTLIDDEIRVAWAEVRADRTHYLQGRPIVGQAALGLRLGIEGLGGRGDGDPLLSRFEADPGALVAYGHAEVYAGLSPRLVFVGRLEGQYSKKPLVAYEEYTAGALTIGRGYDPAFTSGDSALAGSLELRAGPFQPRAGLLVLPFAFVDAARTWDRDIGGLAQTLTSAGVGVQVPVGPRGVADITWAYPLDRREGDRARPSPRLTLNLTTRFF